MFVSSENYLDSEKIVFKQRDDGGVSSHVLEHGLYCSKHLLGTIITRVSHEKYLVTTVEV